MKRLYLPFCLLFICLLSTLSATAQQVDRVPRCNALELLDALPPATLKATLAQRDLLNARAMQPQPHARQFCFDTYRIPVVFHVIHNRGVDSISLAQIQSQVNVLNEDYRRRTGTPGFGSGVDANIEFYLAQRDPGGNATTGVTYTKDSIANFTYNAANDTLLKSKILWAQSRYLNIWVVDTIMFGPSYLLGYAHFPSNGMNTLDGVVIADQHVGDSTGTCVVPPYHRGRTLTHEIGHYLGLYHPFDYVTNPCEGDSAANCATQGDFVCDVPPSNGPHYGCPSFPQNTCTEFPKDTSDYIYNYMEYVDDTCMNMFSQGQATRMHNALDTDSFRLILVSTENIIQSGITYHGRPDANFWFLGSGCVRDSALLFNRTIGIGPQGMPLPDTQFMWSIPGGCPDTSNAQHPMVMYKDTGTYVITLTVTNTYGICMYPMSVTIAGPDLTVGSNTVNLGDSTCFFTSASEPGTWAWNFGDGSGDSASTAAFPKHLYASSDTFYYTAIFTPEDTLQCTVAVQDTAIVLPPPLGVSLVRFEGHYVHGQGNLLEWTTASEVNHDRFVLDRSRNGINYVAIGTIRSAGNSSKLKHYAFPDLHAPEGRSYYRLRQYDRDGALVLSDVIEVTRWPDVEVQSWPNPVDGVLNLRMQVHIGETEVGIEVRDVFGRRLRAEEVELATGTTQMQFDLSDLRAGVYLLRIRDRLSGKALYFEKIVRRN